MNGKKKSQAVKLLQAVAKVCRGAPVSDEEWEQTKSVLGPLHPAEQARKLGIPENQVRPVKITNTN